MKKTKLLVIFLTGLMLLQLAGCSASTSDKFAEEESFNYFSFDSTVNGMAAPQESPMASSDLKDSSAKTSGTGTQNDLSSRKIIKNASLSFETEAYDDFLPALESCIASLGGYIESSEAYGGGIYTSRSRNSYMKVRIPASKYDRFMQEVCAIGMPCAGAAGQLFSQYRSKAFSISRTEKLRLYCLHCAARA